jgi:imidazolonepropionase-like amidohydrolase
LRTATVNPARFLGATDSLGAVAVGKIADFVVLDANPLVSIGNTKRVWGVMANGRWVSSDRSAAMLEKVATMVAPPAPRRP